MPIRETRITRYDRIRKILNEAAAGSSANYGGAGRFWDHGAKRLKEAVIHGVSLIAPEPEKVKSCCGHSADRNDCTRGAASMLIRGLKGEAPFDGSQFPRLPWGGKAVSPEDIEFIGNWIDDGCPEDDRAQTIDAGIQQCEALPVRLSVREIAELDLAAKGTRTPSRPGELRQRGNLDCMDDEELKRLGDAFRYLYSLNDWPEDIRSYNNQALIHQNHCQHGWERFLAWHRAYLYEFEQDLQDYDADIMLPYWDWVMPQYRPECAQNGWIIPKSFQAFLTLEQAEKLVAGLKPKPTATQKRAFLQLAKQKRLFTSQSVFFRYVYNTIGYRHVTPQPQDANRQRMIDALLASNPLWYPLRFPAEYGGKTINEAIHYHYPSADDIQQILSLNNFRDFGGGSIYDASFGFLDQNPHNTLHIWTGGMNPYYDDGKSGEKSYEDSCETACQSAKNGAAERRNTMVRAGGRHFHSRSDMYDQPQYGDMFSNLTASYDPVFWPIHVNVDRLWWEWQRLNPSATPVELDAILSPWNYTVRDTLDAARFGYEYVRSSHFIPVGLNAPIGRIISKPIPVNELTQGFRKAEIRLHWVPQLSRSCFIRAFLNQPGADAKTPLQGNPHFAGYLSIFGHGACYGGPGHCDTPPPRARDYDHRTRNHNTPRNHRIDVTECAGKLLAAGAGELQITLIVIGADYEEDIDLLKLEGVSLNFLD